MKLTDRIALVTGGAHRVGKEIALTLAREGMHVVVHYGASAAEAEQTCAEIERAGGRALPLSADLASPGAITAMFNLIGERFGRLDLLVNSAARFDRGRISDVTIEDWERSMAVNLRAPFMCIQQAARLMHAGERDLPGVVVNIADLSGVHPWAGFAAHGTSKAGLLHLTKIAAHELAPAVRVNALVLGPVMPSQGSSEASSGWQRTLESLPLGRATNPAQVGEAVVFIARSDTLTGAVIHLDSGEGLLGPVRHFRSDL